jgi:hypothetical protein
LVIVSALLQIDRDRRAHDLALPSAQIMASALTERVGHLRITAKRLLKDLLSEAHQQVARITTGICFDEQECASFDDEGSPPKATDVTAEQLLERPTSVPASQAVLHTLWQYSCYACGPFGLGEQSSDAVENLSPVRPPNYKPKQPPHVLVGKPHPLANIFPMRADLAVNDIAQAKTPGHGPRRILFFEELRGQVHVAHDLEQSERDDGLDPARSRR